MNAAASQLPANGAQVSAPPGDERMHWSRSLWIVALAALAYAVLGLWPIDPHDPTDEREWAVVSVAHWNQLFHGTPPPGAAPDEEAWRAGVQGVSFGANNPCLPKLIFGAVLASVGFTHSDPALFTRFQRGDPAERRIAYQSMTPAVAPLRNAVRVFAALGCALTAAIAWELAGALAAGLAFALFVSAPLVRTWSEFARTDFFLVAANVFALWSALALRDELSGRLGIARLLAASALIGIATGFAPSCKFNGAPLVIAGALWIVALWSSARPRASFGLGLAPAVLLQVATAAATFWVLNPVYWRHPLDELANTLDFWHQHLLYQQARASHLGIRVAYDTRSSLALFFERVGERDEPIRAASGWRFGWIVLAASALVASLAALGRLRRASARQRDGAALAWIWCAASIVPTALWLPIDWDRLFLPALPCWILLEACAIGWVGREWRRPAPPSASRL